MFTIHKYHIPYTDEFTLTMPSVMKPLTVQMQRDMTYLWALVDTDAPPREWRFRLANDGHPLDAMNHHYIGTFQIKGRNESMDSVFHLFLVEG